MLFYVKTDDVDFSLKMSFQQLLNFSSRVGLGAASPMKSLIIFNLANSSVAFWQWLRSCILCMNVHAMVGNIKDACACIHIMDPKDTSINESQLVTVFY